MKLDELSRLTVWDDQAGFVRRYPDPALVVLTPLPVRAEDPAAPSEGKASPGAGTYSTRLFRGPFRGTETEDATSHEPLARKLGDADVIFVVARGRGTGGGEITVGRAPERDVWLPIASVSKLHATLRRVEGGGWSLRDERATNFTWVGGDRLQPGAEARLSDGVLLSLGPDVEARFQTPEGLFSLLALHRTGAAS